MAAKHLDLDRLTGDASAALGDGPDPRRLVQQRRDLIAHVESRTRARWPRWQLAAAVAVAVLAAVGLFVWSWSRGPGQPGPRQSGPQQVRYWVGDQTTPARLGRSLRSRGSVPLPLVFAGGTRIVLQPGGLARVERADGQEVRVAISQGRLEAAVRNRGHTRWVVAAGPYRVTALGTRFSVEWDPSSGRIRVAVRAGRVRVEGGNLGDERIELAAGRIFRADRATRSIEVRPLTRRPTDPKRRPVPADRSAPGATTPDAGASPAAADQARSRATQRRDNSSTPRWRTLLAKGRHAAAIRAIGSAGLPRLAQTLPATDLRVLADAARYAGRGGIAVRLLEALRRRFPRSQAARTAAFLLGKVEADLRHRNGRAARWFTVYLRESRAGGPLAQEALGRRIDSNKKAGNKAQAVRDARVYLKRYPRGLFAALARSVLRER